MPADAADVGRDPGGLLGATAVPKNEARLHVGDVLFAELLGGQRLAVFLALFSRIAAMSYLSEQSLGFAARGLGRPDAIKTDRVSCGL